MFVERLLCKCIPFPRPIRHFQSSRRLCLGQTRTARVKVSLRVNKEITLASVEHFMGVFECTHTKAYTILTKHVPLRDVNPERLESAIQMCEMFGIKKQDLLEYPELLAVLPVTIKNHSMLLEESGFTRIAAHTLVNYIPILKKRISLLKAYGYIPAGTDVCASFASHLEPEMTRELGSPPSVVDSETCVGSAGLAVLRRYLTWRLRAEPGRVEAVFKTYHRLKHKSLRMMRRTLDLLEDDIGFTKEKILKNGFLIHTNPENTELMLKTFETLAGQPIRTLLKKYPKILATSVDRIVKTKQHFVDFGVTADAVDRCPEIFTLGSDTVYERLSLLRVVPEFSVLAGHPRILRLVYYQTKARSRLEYLHQLRVKCVSLHILSAPEALFEKYAKDGADKTKGTDISHFLGQELDDSDQLIRNSLTRHPYWCHVPLVAVRETMEFLLEAGFTKKQIIASVQILLYPKERVERELADLPSRPELADGHLLPLRPAWLYAAHERPPPSAPSQGGGPGLGRLPPKRADTTDFRLQMCAYFIEREHHFTGNGIWTHAQSPEGFQSEVVSHSPLTQLASYKRRLP